MPEFSKGQMASRKTVDPRDTFSWSTPNLKVQARPTDPYVKPAVDPNLASFVDSLKNISEITNGYINVQRAYKESNAQQGKADARLGKPMSEPEGFLNGGYGYKEAYNITQGENKGLEFRKEYLAKLEENNYFQNDPGTAQAAQDKFFQDLYTHHFSSVGNNPEIMFGASEEIKQAQVLGSVAFQKATYNTAKTSLVNSVSNLQQDHLFTYAKGNQSEDSLGDLRRLLSDDWNLRVKPSNMMTRDEYSTTVVNNIGIAALKLAQDPTLTTSQAMTQAHKLMSLYDTPDPDTKQSWSSMVDGTGALKFRSKIEEVTQQINNRIEQRTKDDMQRLKEAQANEEKDLFINTVLNPEIPYAAKLEAITKAKNLTESQIEHLTDKAYTYQNEERNIIQDFQAITDLREQVELSDSIDQLKSLRANVKQGYGSVLNASTAKELFDRITSRIDHITSVLNQQTGAGRAERQLSMEEKKMGWDMLKQVVGVKSMTDTDATQAALRVDYYGRLFFSRLAKGESPEKASEDLIQHYSKQIGRTAASVLGPSKYASPAAIMADVNAGKLKPDEGVLEMKRLMSTKHQSSPVKKESPVMNWIHQQFQ